MKKKKRRASQLSETSPIDINKSIKVEVESDLEAPKKKKKRKNTETEDYVEPHESLSAEDYLNLRVKQEQISFAEPEPVKKKKKRKKEKESESETQDSELKETLIERNEVCSTDENSLNSIDEMVVKIDKFEAEETVVQKKKKRRREQANTSEEDTCMVQDNLQEKSTEILLSNNSNEVQLTVTNGHLESDSDFEPKIKTKPAPQVKDLKSKKKSESQALNKSTKISDRITFEDEESADSEKTIVSTSKHLQQFVNRNPNLKPYMPDFQKENIITDDDEVWVLRIPKEVNIKAFKDVNLTIDPKWKVKINGHSYDGIIENHLSQVPLLCHDSNKCYIKNMPLMGEVSLRKRIPKAHIPQESCLINNQTNFIPLPETKCRHPLLGVNYKKAIKIPSAIAVRLNGNMENDTSESFSGKKERKRKQKKEKRKIEKESDPEMDTIELDTTEIEEPSSKKKRKRKHSDDTTKSKKSKHAKPNPDSAEAWESERAIEENLFNF